MPLQHMDWINFKGKVTWKGVQVNYIFMKTVVPDLSLNEEDLFDEFSSVQNNVKANWKHGMKKMNKMLLKSCVKCWPILQRRT
jgi:hypothetical protein